MHEDEGFEPPSVGVALFQNPNDPKRGVCAIAGKAGQSFQTAGDLDTDVLWITNLSFKQALDSRLLSTPRFKTSDFFRVDLPRIAQELGLSMDEQRLECAEVLSGIGHRALQGASIMYELEKIGDSFKRTIEPALLKDPDELALPAYQAALKNSFKTYQLCHDVQPEDGKPYVMRFNRSWFSKKILSFPVPGGKWSHAKLSKQVKNETIKYGPKSNSYQFLCELIDKYPALVKISVRSAVPDIANYIDFAIGTENRTWVPAHEAAQVAFYADVTVKDLLIAERYTSEGEALSIGLGALDNIQDTSISHGLIAENHLHAVYSERKQQINGQWQWITPPRATWWRAWDRVICLKAAITLGREGFFVRGYGTGAIRVVVPQGDISRLRNVASSIGLTSPLTHADIDVDIHCDEQHEKQIIKVEYGDYL